MLCITFFMVWLYFILFVICIYFATKNIAENTVAKFIQDNKKFKTLLGSLMIKAQTGDGNCDYYCIIKHSSTLKQRIRQVSLNCI